jgi:MFS family permease
VLFVLRFNLPETVIWLVQRGQFREAKRIARDLYDDALEMLPDRDASVRSPRLSKFLRVIHEDPIRWRATLYGWLAGFAQGGEFATFAFYLPIMLVLIGFSGLQATNLINLALYTIAGVSGFVGPLLLPRIGQRRLSVWGFGMVAVALVVVAVALFTKVLWLVPVGATVMLWGHYWDSENCMTIPTMVAPPRYRGTASGFSYIFVKIPSFLSIIIFPTIFDAIGHAAATLLVLVFTLTGLGASLFVLPATIDGFRDDVVEEPPS